MSIKNRLARLEAENAKSCPKCAHTPRRVAGYYPERGEEPPAPESSPECGRELLVVLRIVHEDVRGEGDTYWPDAPA
jgi:hypothetical protein